MTKRYPTKRSITRSPFALLAAIAFCFPMGEGIMAQDQGLDEVLEPFNEYTASYREVAYAHLNKSTYIKGEGIGFSAYVFDKESKVPSDLTKNLYCVITDVDGQVVKSKLVMVNNGFANNVFEIDSTFTSGSYTFKAFTNWMKNFEEPNAFVESFRVIDPEVERTVERTLVKNVVDAQFLPEGGHLVHGVQSNVGVVIKDGSGLGISGMAGKVYDSNGGLVSEFKTNAMGIGKFQLKADKKLSYTAKIEHLSMPFEFDIDQTEERGIAIKVNKHRKGATVVLQTNQETLPSLQGRTFKLTVHNGKRMNGMTVGFEDEQVVRLIDGSLLFPGINIFTLFDDNNTPVLERMFFNFKGVNIVASGESRQIAFNDSVQVTLPLRQFADASVMASNVSISVLPEETNSYKRHHNIISHTFLQPYLKGFIENAHYYFTDIDAKKEFELDNLLLTQGWSSYDWKDIFSGNVTDTHVFEDGIMVKAIKYNQDNTGFMLYPLKNNEAIPVELPDDQNSFVVTSLYPEGREKLGVATANKRGKVTKPSLQMRFFPSEMPDYEPLFEALRTKSPTITNSMPSAPLKSFNLGEIQQLDEVTVKARKRDIEIERVKENQFAKVKVFDDTMRRMNLSFAAYINFYVPEFAAREFQGRVFIYRRVPSSLRTRVQIPVVFLDDMIVSPDFLYGFNTEIVDYITINATGIGESFFAANGVIRIYTSLDFVEKTRKNGFRQFDFPLAFSENKRYYVPKYDVYNNEFFKNYGVFNWVPNGQVDQNGNLTFSFYKPADGNVKLFIEGVTSKGDFISEVITLNADEMN